DPLDDSALERLRVGVELKDGPTRPARVKRTEDAHIEITITEGRNRQVRRMIEAVGSRVVELERTRLGTLLIGDLKPGAWRNLTAAEVARLTT
ncbi:MAG: rRNA pseudouridine synthase, partial [Terriglobia bacterium]